MGTFANFVLNLQLFGPQTKCPGLSEDDMYDDFNIDEVDLNLENYEELFGVTLNHSEELLENGGIDGLFGTKDMSAADSTCLGAAAAEVISISFVLALRYPYYLFLIVLSVF